MLQQVVDEILRNGRIEQTQRQTGVVLIAPVEKVPNLAPVSGSGFAAAGAAACRQEPTHQLGIAPDGGTGFGSVKHPRHEGDGIGAIHPGEHRRHLP